MALARHATDIPEKRSALASPITFRRSALKALSRGLPPEHALEFQKLVLESYIRYTPLTVERLQAACRDGRVSDAWRHAHSLRAAARMFGSTRLLTAIDNFHMVLVTPGGCTTVAENKLLRAYEKLLRKVQSVYAEYL